jgi:hypothetical protein
LLGCSALLTGKSEENVVGKKIRVNEVPTSVLGVMPAKMQFRTSVDMWTPLMPKGDWEKREYRALVMLGRLKEGVRIDSARAESRGLRAAAKRYCARPPRPGRPAAPVFFRRLCCALLPLPVQTRF